MASESLLGVGVQGSGFRVWGVSRARGNLFVGIILPDSLLPPVPLRVGGGLEP